MNENPPPESEIKSVLPQFKYLGIELGKPWNREAVDPLVLAEMRKAAEGIGPLALGTSPLGGTQVHGWTLPPEDVAATDGDYLVRLIVAVLGLTANTIREGIYYFGLLDSNNQPLTGENRYTVIVTEPMNYLRPIPPGFWSLSMYDGVTRYGVPNPINRYSLGSDNNIKKNADGSFTPYIQHDNPGPDKESNWLPAPAGPFYLMLRNYAPIPAAWEGLKDPATFIGPPPVVPVGG